MILQDCFETISEFSPSLQFHNYMVERNSGSLVLSGFVSGKVDVGSLSSVHLYDCRLWPCIPLKGVEKGILEWLCPPCQNKSTPFKGFILIQALYSAWVIINTIRKVLPFPKFWGTTRPYRPYYIWWTINFFFNFAKVAILWILQNSWIFANCLLEIVSDTIVYPQTKF